MIKTLYITPKAKKGKDSALCKSKRPISLLNVAAKILESMAHVRLIRTFGPSLPQNQYAYQRDKGAEFRVTETFEFLAREREAGRHIYLAAVDVESAFDSVPRKKVLQALTERKADGHILRYLRKWLTERRFILRLQSPPGVHFSTRRNITRGLPQGGILSPFLWMVHFYSLKTDLGGRRSQRNAGTENPEKYDTVTSSSRTMP